MFCTSLSTERKTVEATLPIKSYKKLVFQFKFGLENVWRYLHSAKEDSSKTDETQISLPDPKACILHKYQIFSKIQKWAKFIRKSLVTIPILKGNMVP